MTPRFFLGIALAAGGASLVGFLWLQTLDRSGRTMLVYKMGMPADLLLAALGVILFVFGLHLMVSAKRGAVRLP